MSDNVHGHQMPEKQQHLNVDNPIFARQQPEVVPAEIPQGLHGAPQLRSETEPGTSPAGQAQEPPVEEPEVPANAEAPVDPEPEAEPIPAVESVPEPAQDSAIEAADEKAHDAAVAADQAAMVADDAAANAEEVRSL